MAYTVSIFTGGKAIRTGTKKVTYCDVTFTGNYTTGGEALTAQDFAMKNIQFVSGVVTDAAGATTAMPVYYNRSTSKLQMYESGAANAPLAEKGSAEAYAASSVGHLIVTGT